MPCFFSQQTRTSPTSDNSTPLFYGQLTFVTKPTRFSSNRSQKPHPPASDFFTSWATPFTTNFSPLSLHLQSVVFSEGSLHAIIRQEPSTMPTSQNLNRPRTEAQKEASRRNGAKSNGPITPMGKSTCSRNALRHGLYASDIALTSENPEAFAQVLAEYMDEYQPQGPTETSLVEQIAIAQFRLYRSWTTETALYNIEMADNDERLSKKYAYMAHPIRTADATETMLARGNALPHISRCQTRAARDFHRALNQLLALRKPLKSTRKTTANTLEIAETDPAISLETQDIEPPEPSQPSEPESPQSASGQQLPWLPLVAALILALGALALHGAAAAHHNKSAAFAGTGSQPGANLFLPEFESLTANSSMFSQNSRGRI
jgi:hypothetical protein